MAGYQQNYMGRGIFQNPTNVAWNSVQLGQKAPANLAVNPMWGQTSMETSPSNPVLPALWWLGLVIILIVIRVLTDRYSK